MIFLAIKIIPKKEILWCLHNQSMIHRLYNTGVSYIFSMVHGLHNIVRPMAHGRGRCCTIHGSWGKCNPPEYCTIHDPWEICTPWPMGCTMLCNPWPMGGESVVQLMGHGENVTHQNIVQSMTHGKLVPHDPWVIQCWTTLHHPWVMGDPLTSPMGHTMSCNVV